MKFSTRARYGLRMMVELARLLEHEHLVHLGRIARITGLSENYLAQLAISLRNDGLLIGVSGQRGGYQLARPASQIRVGDIIKALIGPISLTDCVTNPNVCMNSGACETRTVWAIVNHRVQETLDSMSLADLIRRDWLSDMQQKHADLALLFPDRMVAALAEDASAGCPGKKDVR
ncbi:MAG: Rrf2 family transcriptional regulator [candidate division Zixibacteria bacterium]|jgi:Rrf2 family protein|nr:Rrf2 family transcriptional regulator [candidate division Zixibacteria bacterium]